MIRIFAVATLISLASLSLADEVETFVDELLAKFPAEEVNAHTCRRVQELGRNTVTPQECNDRLEQANSECRSLATQYFDDAPSEADVELLGAIVMVCPIAKVLNISFRIIDGKAHIGWSELPEQ